MVVEVGVAMTTYCVTDHCHGNMPGYIDQTLTPNMVAVSTSTSAYGTILDPLDSFFQSDISYSFWPAIFAL